MGPLEVPADAYYGVQTQRAVTNFPISGWPLPPRFIHAIAAVVGNSSVNGSGKMFGLRWLCFYATTAGYHGRLDGRFTLTP